MVTGHERRCHFGPSPTGTDGHAVPECLGHGHNVRLDPQVLESEPAPGAAQSGLDLVHDQQDVPIGAHLTHPGQVVRRRHHHPGLAQDGFEEDRPHPVRVARSFHGIEVVERHVIKALEHRQERRLFVCLAGRGQRGHGPAVEGIPCRHHPESTRSRPPPGQFQGALVGLGSGVAEEDLAAGPLAATADQPIDGDGHLGADRRSRTGWTRA